MKNLINLLLGMLGRQAQRLAMVMLLVGNCVGLPSLHAQDTAISRGLSWLQVGSDGSLPGQGGGVATALQCRSEAAATLRRIANVPAALTAAIDADPEDNTEYLARKALSRLQAGQGASAMLDQLAARQNGDGGWGGAPYYASNPLDTAWALQAMVSGGASDPSYITRAKQYLISKQNVSGGFSFDDNPASVNLTALASYALQQGVQVSGQLEAVVRANSWLMSVQQENGGWGTVHETALAYLAVVGTVSDLKLLGAASNFLQISQAGDGSWNGDPYQTALALRALAQRPVVSPTAGNVIGRVIDPNSGQPIASATISLLQLPGVATRSPADGSFELANVPAASYTLLVSASGYANFSAPLDVRSGVSSNVGVVALTPNSLPDAGPAKVIIKGAARDGATGAPLAGVQVSVPGTTAVAMTQADGSYQLPELAAGIFKIVAAKSGYANVVADVSASSGGAITFSPTLMQSTTTGSITGRVIDAASGQPLVGAMAQIAALGKAATTGADGSFAFPGLPTGALKLDVTAPGYVAASATAVITADGTINFQSIALGKTATPATNGTIEGQVRDESTGQVLAGVQVTATGASALVASTAADGSFRLANVVPGNYLITASKAGYDNVTGGGMVEAGVLVNFSPSMRATAPKQPGVIEGKVTDAASGTSIAGATIAVSGPVQLTATSAADGTFRFASVPAGQVVVTISKSGYLTATGNAQVQENTIVRADSRLEKAPAAGLSGRVVDMATLAPLGGVAVEAASAVNGNSHTVLTDAAGRFSMPELPPDLYLTQFRRDGYTLRNGTASVGGALVDVGDVKLARSDSTVAIFGVVKDVETQKPIGQATVSVVGTQLTATTDATGKYRLEGVAQGDRTVRFGAQGYTSETVALLVSPYNDLPVDGSLHAGTGSDIRLAIVTDTANYVAYAPVAITVKVNNSGSESINGGIAATVKNEQGEYIESIVASQADANGGVSNVLTFAPGESLVQLSWNTRDTAPGRYSIDVRMAQLAPGTERGAIELAQQQGGIVIDPTQAIESVTLTPLPAFSRLGAVEQLGFKVDVVNRSNVKVSTKLAYVLNSPSGTQAMQGEFELDLAPAESSKSVLLPGPEYKFLASGDYLSQLTVVDGEVPSQLAGNLVAVAPGTRIDPSLKVAPESVTPDGDKRVRVEIRLQGVEQK